MSEITTEDLKNELLEDIKNKENYIVTNKKDYSHELSKLVYTEIIHEIENTILYNEGIIYYIDTQNNMYYTIKNNKLLINNNNYYFETQIEGMIGSEEIIIDIPPRISIGYLTDNCSCSYDVYSLKEDIMDKLFKYSQILSKIRNYKFKESVSEHMIKYLPIKHRKRNIKNILND